MTRVAKLALSAAAVLGYVLFSPPENGRLAWAQNNCQQCPGTHFCACTNCTNCNSGSFAVMCVCYRGPAGGPLVNSCSGDDGVCNSRCAKCVEQNLKTGRVCTTYQGCPGQTCPGGGCVPPLRALAGSPCQDCQVSELEDRSGPQTVRVRLERPSGFPIDFLDFVTEGERTKEVRIRNTSKAGLVTLLLGVTYRAHDGEVHSTIVKADSWHMDAAFLGPGSVDTVPQMSQVTHPSGIASIQIRPVYAEFDDGTPVGADAFGTRMCLRRERMELASVIDDARRRVEQAGASQAAIAAAMQNDSRLGFLQVDLDRGGIEAVLARLRGPRRFEP